MLPRLVVKLVVVACVISLRPSYAGPSAFLWTKVPAVCPTECGLQSSQKLDSYTCTTYDGIAANDSDCTGEVPNTETQCQPTMECGSCNSIQCGIGLTHKPHTDVCTAPECTIQECCIVGDVLYYWASEPPTCDTVTCGSPASTKEEVPYCKASDSLIVAVENDCTAATKPDTKVHDCPATPDCDTCKADDCGVGLSLVSYPEGHSCTSPICTSDECCRIDEAYSNSCQENQAQMSAALLASGADTSEACLAKQDELNNMFAAYEHTCKGSMNVPNTYQAWCAEKFGASVNQKCKISGCSTAELICTTDVHPVCGCDGTTYSNACAATCVSSYTDGECDINECTDGTHTCDANAVCTDTEEAFSCACASGYTGDGTTCADINECTDGTHTCDANAVCTNTDGTFSCACASGYTGDGTTCTDKSNSIVASLNFVVVVCIGLLTI